MKKELPKYETIYQDLKQKIMNGFFSDGRLPALSELVKMYDASLLTVNNAVKKLAEEGFVSRGQGRSGTWIKQPGLLQISQNSQNLNSWNDSLENICSRRVTLRYLSDRRSTFLPMELNGFIKVFERRYPWIHVVQDFTDNVDFLKQSDHDLIQGSHAILLPLIEQKKLLNLEPYFEAFGRANRILHDQYTAPLMMTLPLLFCKKGEISSVPKNWDEFFALNRKLKAEGKYSASLLGFVSLLFFFIGNIRQNLLLPEKEPQLRQAIQLLYEYYHWKAPWNTLSPQAIMNVALEHDISMYLGYYCNQIADSKYMFEPELMPYPGKYLIETIRIGINANCPHPSEAWLFVNFLRSEYIQRKIVENNYGIPYRESVFENEFRKKSPKLHRLIAPLLDKLEESHVSEEAREMIYYMVYPLLEQCFARECSLDECVVSLRNAMNELLILDDIQTKLIQ